MPCAACVAPEWRATTPGAPLYIPDFSGPAAAGTAPAVEPMAPAWCTASRRCAIGAQFLLWLVVACAMGLLQRMDLSGKYVNQATLAW